MPEKVTNRWLIAGIMVASCILALIVRPPAAERDGEPSGRFTRKDEEVSEERETARSGA